MATSRSSSNTLRLGNSFITIGALHDCRNHIEGSWIHIPPNGPTSETNAPRDHDQYHPVKQEENGGIQGKVRKHEKIY